MKYGTVLLIGLAASTLAGCGVKNTPVAPATNAAPAVSGAEPAAQPADTAAGRPVEGFITGDPEDSGVARRATITSPDTDAAVSAAEITRNPQAARRNFFLDPLLN